jgi:hypothetical protein
VSSREGNGVNGRGRIGLLDEVNEGYRELGEGDKGVTAKKEEIVSS